MMPFRTGIVATDESVAQEQPLGVARQGDGTT